MGNPFQRYRIDEGDHVDLGKIPTEDDSAFGGSKEEGKARLLELADRLAVLQEKLYAQDEHRLLVVLQAMDTAGKDSTIRDVFNETNPMGVQATPFRQPSDEELAHDYLWRVHPHTPARGQIAIFNRSHYEDVLVVRVEGFAPEKQWKRRYRHIREFERMLADEGTTILKLYLHISKEEQKRRLEERLEIPDKRWKFSIGDLATRQKWGDYMKAYEDAIAKTSTDDAPWYVIPADRRWYRKLAVAEIITDTLEGMDLAYPPEEPGLEGLVIPD